MRSTISCSCISFQRENLLRTHDSFFCLTVGGVVALITAQRCRLHRTEELVVHADVGGGVVATSWRGERERERRREGEEEGEESVFRLSKGKGSRV